MRYQVIHELPHRLRIRLVIPQRPILDDFQIQSRLSSISGLREVSFNSHTGSLLVKYNGHEDSRATLLKTIQEMPLDLPRRKSREENALEQKKRAILISGLMLAAGPAIPLGLKPCLALYGSRGIFSRGLRSLFRGRVDAQVLDATAIGVAVAMKDYWTAGVISLMLKVGDYLEEKTRQSVRKSLKEIFYPQESMAWVKRNGRPVRVDAKEIAADDLVIVGAGSAIPVDGVVVEGEAMVVQSSLTGEPFPVVKRPGITVYAGMAVEEGRLVVKATSIGNETRVSRIIQVIEESEGLKAEVQSQAERLANRIAPYAFLLSGLTYALTGNPIRAASVLLVDYSCAIKLSTPLTVMSAMIDALRRGVLIKGGKFIEKLAGADLFVFDKTGTLTEARPRVIDAIPFSGFKRDHTLKYAACVEEHFPHPVATAVVQKAEEESLIHDEERHVEVEYVLAHGIASRIKGKRILVGSRHFVHEDEGISVECAEPVIQGFSERGHSLLYVAVGEKLAGIIAVEDPVREESDRFLRRLQDAGVKRVIMLTGDGCEAARDVAERLGIREFYAQVFPDRKTEIIRELKREGHVVAMVGDGINDSPALSLADVGISMKHGADIAKEAADVILLDGRLEGIVEAKRVSREAMSRIQQNFRYIIGINTALIGLGMTGALTPFLSAFIHNATTVIVAANSLRPYRAARGKEEVARGRGPACQKVDRQSEAVA